MVKVKWYMNVEERYMKKVQLCNDGVKQYVKKVIWNKQKLKWRIHLN